jgi:hypothetical protein
MFTPTPAVRRFVISLALLGVPTDAARASSDIRIRTSIGALMQAPGWRRNASARAREVP